MSRFKTAAIAPSFHNGVVFKRKGNKVRYFDPATAKVSGWLNAPEMNNAHAAAVNTPAKGFERMTVAELRSLATVRGIKVPSKARKADIVAALTGE